MLDLYTIFVFSCKRTFPGTHKAFKRCFNLFTDNRYLQIIDIKFSFTTDSGNMDSQKFWIGVNGTSTRIYHSYDIKQNTNLITFNKEKIIQWFFFCVHVFFVCIFRQAFTGI